jgi:PAS domain S-box-containing protein
MEAEQRMRAILETANDAIITMDGAGVIQTANLAAERIFGFIAPELIGKSVKDLMPPTWHAEYRRRLPSIRKMGNAASPGCDGKHTACAKTARSWPWKSR